MTYRTFRRRLSEATAAYDWLEGLAFVLGLAFLALAVLWLVYGAGPAPPRPSQRP